MIPGKCGVSFITRGELITVNFKHRIRAFKLNLKIKHDELQDNTMYDKILNWNGKIFLPD